jgi:hypothetical protein
MLLNNILKVIPLLIDKKYRLKLNSKIHLAHKQRNH